MKLTREQKERYISWFEEQHCIDELTPQIDKVWTLKKVKDHDDELYELSIGGVYQDDIYQFGYLELMGVKL